jgi:hypothetical protein
LRRAWDQLIFLSGNGISLPRVHNNNADNKFRYKVRGYICPPDTIIVGLRAISAKEWATLLQTRLEWLNLNDSKEAIQMLLVSRSKTLISDSSWLDEFRRFTRVSYSVWNTTRCNPSATAPSTAATHASVSACKANRRCCCCENPTNLSQNQTEALPRCSACTLVTGNGHDCKSTTYRYGIFIT